MIRGQKIIGQKGPHEELASALRRFLYAMFIVSMGRVACSGTDRESRKSETSPTCEASDLTSALVSIRTVETSETIPVKQATGIIVDPTGVIVTVDSFDVILCVF